MGKISSFSFEVTQVEWNPEYHNIFAASSESYVGIFKVMDSNEIHFILKLNHWNYISFIKWRLSDPF